MEREIDLAFIKLHILHHAGEGEVFGIGLIEELEHHGYDIGPGTLYPTLGKMEQRGWLTCESRVIQGKVRKYYRSTELGRSVLAGMRHKLQELHHELLEEHHEHAHDPAGHVSTHS